MKIFGNWLGFLAVATGAAHLIFAIDSNSIDTDKSKSNKDTTNKNPEKGRASYLWEKRVSPPYPYQQYHQYKSILTPVQHSNTYPGVNYLKTNIQPTVSSRIADVAGADQPLERHGHPKKTYGYSGGGSGVQHYYPAQPLPYYPATKEHSFSFGRFGFFKPLILILILPFFLLFFFTTIVYVAQAVAASSSSTTAALSQQQQQQQDSNNNNNNANNNNDNNNNAIILSSGTGTFVITINATGRANEDERLSVFKNPASLFNWHNSFRALPPVLLNETLLLA
ncbi:hypothetical protein GHT06_009714 [Daphnia sinensis]|uniref:Uncharacterized protein n=1 Tax=Daphnia sinensis TaxID=1820382 RepID=A0AAD5LNC5_9CRUS|nr:hypothetical protein GHT06_009714 [Daphnia sinensis]